MESRRVFFVAHMVPLKVSIHHLIRLRHPSSRFFMEIWSFFNGGFHSHDGSMGLEDLPTFTIKINVNVGKYTIHGSYGMQIASLNSTTTCWIESAKIT